MTNLNEGTFTGPKNRACKRARVRLYEPRYEKTRFLHMQKTKMQISCAATAQLISAFVFTIRIVQSLYYLNPKFQASSHLMWLYSLVCVGPGPKLRRLVFSQRGSYDLNEGCAI